MSANLDRVRSICAAWERGRLQLRRVGGSQYPIHAGRRTPCCAAAPSVRCEAEVEERPTRALVMNAGVSVKTAESAELDEKQHSSRLTDPIRVSAAAVTDRAPYRQQAATPSSDGVI
jgi:hypothetical protein